MRRRTGRVAADSRVRADTFGHRRTGCVAPVEMPLEVHMLVVVVVIFNILELVVEIVPNFPTIQKPYYRQFSELSMGHLADDMKPKKFTGVHFKR